MNTRPSCYAITLLWVSLLVPITLMRGTCIPLTAPPDAPLADDARLKRPVTLRETGTSLKELLDRLSDKELTLLCSASCASQKLHIHLRNRPLSILLSALADLLPGTWEPLEDKKGYRLVMSSKAVQERDEWWRLFLEQRQRTQKLQADTLFGEMGRTPKERPVLFESRTEGATHPDTIRAFFNLLPEPLKQRIANPGDDPKVYSLLSFGGMERDAEGAVIVDFDTLPQEARDLVLEERPEENVSHPIALAQFSNRGSRIAADFIGADGKPKVSTFVFNAEVSSSIWSALRLDHSDLARSFDEQDRNAPPEWKQLAAYQRKRVWKNSPPKGGFQYSIPPTRRADALLWLAEAAKIEFVADYYSLPGLPMTPQAKAEPLTQPLPEQLDRLVAEQDMSWKQSGDIYLFRDNRWYRDDNLEAPSVLAKRWLADRLSKSTKPASPPSPPSPAQRLKAEMDWGAELVSSLSRWQIANGLQWLFPEGREEDPGLQQFARPSPALFRQYPFYQDAARTNYQYNLTQFYSSLGEQARQALCEGRLPFASLSPTQQTQALALAPALSAAVKLAFAPLLLGIGPSGPISPKLSLIFRSP